MKRFLLVGLLLSLMVLGIAVEITVAFPRHEMDVVGYWDSVIAEFEKATNVKVKQVRLGWDDMANKIITELGSGGSSYDVIELDHSWVAKFASLGWIIPLDEYLTKEMKEDIPPALMERFSYNGHVYGVVWNNDLGFFMYNKELLRKAGICRPPRTWEELSLQSKILQQKGLVKYGIIWPWEQAEALTTHFLMLLYSFGGDVFDGDGNVIVNNEAGVEALTWMVQGLKEGVIDPGSVSASQEAEMNVFLQGSVAFMPRAWPTAYSYSLDPDLSKIVGEAEIGLLPGKYSFMTVSILLPEAFAIPSTSKHKNEAWKFIEFVRSKEKDRELVLKLGALPMYSSLYNDPEIKAKYPYFEKLLEIMKYGRGVPQVPYYDELSYYIQVEISNALTGVKTPKQALDDLAEKLKELQKEFK